MQAILDYRERPYYAHRLAAFVEGAMGLTRFTGFLRRVLPAKVFNLLSCIRNWRDLPAILAFLHEDTPAVTLAGKLRIARKMYVISLNVESPHTQAEILAMVRTVLALPRGGAGVVVEAGCFKGSSTSKFSLAADIVERKLVVFDSFAGIPGNTEAHGTNIFGRGAKFDRGDYCGTIDEVQANVARFGAPGRCEFIQGWFDDTMPAFNRVISAAYIDVDLASSTRTCLKYLFPLLERGGTLYSQDGHLPLVIDVLDDDAFWLNEVGCPKPKIEGLRVRKLVKIVKE